MLQRDVVLYKVLFPNICKKFPNPKPAIESLEGFGGSWMEHLSFPFFPQLFIGERKVKISKSVHQHIYIIKTIENQLLPVGFGTESQNVVRCFL